jgi:hypothetical protein
MRPATLRNGGTPAFFFAPPSCPSVHERYRKSGPHLRIRDHLIQFTAPNQRHSICIFRGQRFTGGRPGGQGNGHLPSANSALVRFFRLRVSSCNSRRAVPTVFRLHPVCQPQPQKGLPASSPSRHQFWRVCMWRTTRSSLHRAHSQYSPPRGTSPTLQERLHDAPSMLPPSRSRSRSSPIQNGVRPRWDRPFPRLSRRRDKEPVPTSALSKSPCLMTNCAQMVRVLATQQTLGLSIQDASEPTPICRYRSPA